MKRNLVAAYGNYGNTEALLGTNTLPDGTTVSRLEIEPIIGAYRRMIRDLEFDVSELAPVTYMIARSQGAPITALPIFLSRKFHYSDIVVRADSEILTPKDIEGKRFGVRAYTVTTAVWVRGILARHGVDLSKVRWVVDDDDHVEGLQLPPNIERLTPGQWVADAFASGDLQVALRGNAGVGRKGSPLTAWNAGDISGSTQFQFRPLFADPVESAAADYRQDGICPMHRTVVVKDEIVADLPHLPRMLFDLFRDAKDAYVTRLESVDTAAAAKDREVGRIVGGDPLPYGLENNWNSIEEMANLGKSDGLLGADADIRSMFYDLN